MAVSGILGKKIGMTQLFDDKGDVHPVTVLQAGPCVVTQRKTVAKDGYDAAQIGLVEFVKESRLTKAMKGHFAKNNLPPLRFLREVPIVIDPEARTETAPRSATRFWSRFSKARSLSMSPEPARDAVLPAW